jgi:hypothetical protein
MLRGGSYPIEEFLEAITAQLDKTQDALRLKSVNRPLTFALKDFNLDLQVFVEMDEQGQIRFRPSRPNEQGSSTVNIGFTTITRPMIEENTVSMELTKSPTLEEVGLDPDERRQLERLGVRNAAQLKRLESQAGDSNLSRLSGVNVARLRQALQMGRPRIDNIAVENEPAVADQLDPRINSVMPGPDRGSRRVPVEMPGYKNPDNRVVEGRNVGNGSIDHNDSQPRHPGISIEEVDGGVPVAEPLPRLRVSDRARKLKLRGGNLLDEGRAPRARLDRRDLAISRSLEDEVIVELPEMHHGGLLEIDLPDGSRERYELVVEPAAAQQAGGDPWMPARES